MRILTEPQNALIKQYIALLETEGVHLDFTADAVEEIARIAAEVNERTENIGARRLHTVLERLLDEVSFDGPGDARAHRVDRRDVRARAARPDFAGSGSEPVHSVRGHGLREKTSRVSPQSSPPALEIRKRWIFRSARTRVDRKIQPPRASAEDDRPSRGSIAFRAPRGRLGSTRVRADHNRPRPPSSRSIRGEDRGVIFSMPSPYPAALLLTLVAVDPLRGRRLLTRP